jgi:Uma2 family endonuclease
MTIADPPALSQQDWRRLAKEGGVEFVGGQIVEKPVSMESSRIGSTINRLLGNEAVKSKMADVFDSSLGYKVFPEDPEKFRKPDVSLIRVEKLAGISPRSGFSKLPADLAVEVISPGDVSYDVSEKVEEYLRHGFGILWVVHPNTRSVLVYRSDGSTTLLHEQDEITGESALPTFRCKVSEFFATSASFPASQGLP